MEKPDVVFHLLFTGYVGGRTASTVSAIAAGGHLVVVDPGMVPSRAAITEPLALGGYEPEDVTDVVISHHHPDHTMNIALFPRARVHDHWAVYHNDRWISRPAEGFEVCPGVTLWETPGHTPQDISTVVSDSRGVTVLTHLWWDSSGPHLDPFASDGQGIVAGRKRVLEVADLVVPGHGAPFVPGDDTPV